MGDTPLAQLEERIEKLEAAAADIREATREAHSATKELRRARKEVEQLLGADLRKVVDDAIGDQVKAGLEAYKQDIVAGREKAVDTIRREFDKLADAFLTGSGKPAAHLMLTAHRAREQRRIELGEIGLHDA